MDKEKDICNGREFANIAKNLSRREKNRLLFKVISNNLLSESDGFKRFEKELYELSGASKKRIKKYWGQRILIL